MQKCWQHSREQYVAVYGAGMHIFHSTIASLIHLKWSWSINVILEAKKCFGAVYMVQFSCRQ